MPGTTGRGRSDQNEWQESVKNADILHACNERYVCRIASPTHSADLLTFFQEVIRRARMEYEEATNTVVTSALGHRIPTRVTPAQHGVDSSPSGPAGSFWSNDRIPPPPPSNHQSILDSNATGFVSREPTPARPQGLYQPHSALRDPDFFKFADADDRLPRGNMKDNTDAESSSSGDSKKSKSKSSPRVDPLVQLMRCDNDGMVLFGRWKHHKDAPLSSIRELIEKEFREPGCCSLYGSGILPIKDHPLVLIYNARLNALSKDKEFDPATDPPLSPIMMLGHDESQRASMRLKTLEQDGGKPNKDGIWQDPPFKPRSASTSSTIISLDNDDASRPSKKTLSKSIPPKTMKKSNLCASGVQGERPQIATPVQPRDTSLPIYADFEKPAAMHDSKLNWDWLVFNAPELPLPKPVAYVSARYVVEVCDKPAQAKKHKRSPPGIPMARTTTIRSRTFQPPLGGQTRVRMARTTKVM